MKGNLMNWDRIEGNWKQLKGKAKQQWGELTDDDLDVIAGKRDVLAGKIQECYGITKDEAEKQLNEWQDMQDKDPVINSLGGASRVDGEGQRLHR
jgi:uncharacterized protein YjbJ (UPF0337 family)